MTTGQRNKRPKSNKKKRDSESDARQLLLSEGFLTLPTYKELRLRNLSGYAAYYLRTV